MKNVKNSFKVSGFVGFSEIRKFSNSSVCKFSLSISRMEPGSNEWTSAFLNAEAWRKNENVDELFILTKGEHVTIEGFYKPEEWTDEEGKDHNRVVMVATKFYPTEEKED